MEKFKKLIRINEKIIEDKIKQYNLISHLRLGTAVLAIILTYSVIDFGKRGWILIGAMIAIISFIILLIKHYQMKEVLNKAKAMRSINERYLARIDGTWISFKDTGEEYLETHHSYALDLDIVGDKSLFQMINTTSTWYGREQLANDLLRGINSEEEIVSRQQAVKELGNKLSFCQQMEYVGKKNKMTTMPVSERFLSYCEKEELIIARKREQWIFILPFITVTFLALAFLMSYQILFFIGVGLVISQCMISLVYVSKFNEVLSSARELEYLLGNYHHLLKVIEQETFHSPKLIGLKNILINGEHSAVKGIEDLEKISAKVNLSRHPLLALPLNALVLWECKRLVDLEKWRQDYGKQILKWLKAIGEIEALISLCVLLHIDEKMSFPLVEKEENILHAKEMGHPLLKQEIRVTNDMNLDKQIFVITGSNMSGKTTFLRTVGINLVLAYSGAPVCATALSCSRFSIYTSMRIRDDLKEGLSTFYAELLRIKQIIEAANKEEAMIFLIDEIFRGTNSVDRIDGAKSILESLNNKGVIGAITTHDLELCQLATWKGVTNYHFTEYYEKNKILFDYKLKIGPSTSTNAKYLMKMVGIE